VVIFFCIFIVMDKVDVQIYLSQIKTFFKENPNQLLKLIGKAKPEDFFDGIERIALSNLKNGDDVQLTNNQMIQLVVDLNGKEQKIKKKEVLVPYQKFKFGKIYLN